MASKIVTKVLYIVFVVFLLSILVYLFVQIVLSLKQRNEVEEFVLKLLNSKTQKVATVVKESCQSCHSIETSFEKYHNPSTIGCISCHLGNPNESDKKLAHTGLVLFPGNLKVVEKTCGRSECHKEIALRVEKSLMNTMSGVVSVDKFVFGEIVKPVGKYKISEIGNTPAEVHLRNLCASCHLGKEKKEFGPIDEISRGGGCSSCHLQYEHKSIVEIDSFKRLKNFVPKYHPRISIHVEQIACFGCHSRSGRISTNYVGLMETTLGEIPKSDSSQFVKIADGRVFAKVQPDIHYTKGMTCIDCHTSREIMGDGHLYEHKEQQIEISCADCHFDGTPKTTQFDSLDNETKMIIYLRGWQSVTNKRFVVISKSSKAFSNVLFDQGKVIVLSKSKNKAWQAMPPSRTCLTQREMHPNLDCNACHIQWVPRCVSCHTYYEPTALGWDNLRDEEVSGCWMEKGGNFFASKPTLGNLFRNGKSIITTFIPGMILTIDGKAFPQNSFAKRSRFFAPTFSHTISKTALGCKECHLNPLVFGFGEGAFKLEKKGGRFQIVFQSNFELDSISGLPKDAWIGFEKFNLGHSTRTNASSFNYRQIRNMLSVGSCYFCHNWDTKKSIDIFSKDYKKLVTKKCFLPK